MSEDAANPIVAKALETAKLLCESPKAVPMGYVVEVLKVLPAYFHTSQCHTEMSGIKSSADWCGYEMRLWELSECVRRYLQLNYGIRGRCDILDSIAHIIGDRRFGKGRQNFVLILGQYGGQEYADTIGELLNDQEVMGHAVKALARSKAPDYIERIKLILSESPVGWIRDAARKYLEIVQC